MQPLLERVIQLDLAAVRSEKQAPGAVLGETVLHLYLGVAAGQLLVALDRGLAHVLDKLHVRRAGGDRDLGLVQLQQALQEQVLEQLAVLALVTAQLCETLAGKLKQLVQVLLAGLQDLKSRLVALVRLGAVSLSVTAHTRSPYAHLLLHLDVLLLLVVRGLNVPGGLVHDAGLLNGELLVGLDLDLVRFLGGLLPNEGHHLLQLREHLVIVHWTRHGGQSGWI